MDKTFINFSRRERQLDFILNAIPSLISYVDADLRYQFMNSAYQKWFGLQTDSCLGKTMQEVLGETAFLALKEHVNEVLTGRPVHFEKEIPYPSGKMHIDAIYTPEFDEQSRVVGFTVLVNDITEQKKLERELLQIRNREALQKSEERYHKMVDEIQDYVVILLSREGIVENWNKGAEKIKGYKDHEVIGKNFRLFYTQEDQDNKIPELLIEEAISNKKAIHEGWRTRKDGSTFWASTIITALHDENGHLIGFTKVSRDLTERKHAEDIQKQYTNRLEFQNKELEQFAYAASHDLQEPLRKIRTFNERILKLEPLSENAQDYFNRSIAAAHRMQKLIDDLLAYSRANMDVRNFDWIDLNAIKEDVLLSKKEAIDEKSATIESNHLPLIYAIPFQIWQLLDNLIGNALKYAHPDRKPYIKITTHIVPGSDLSFDGIDHNKSYHRIRIADNGMGFDQQYAEKIFDIFQRLHGHSKLPGSGIGLAICKKIVKNHSGVIVASAKLNEGATFDIYLPAS